MTAASQLTAAVEDYLKAIYALSARGNKPIQTTALAARLEVSPPSVSAMVKKLADLGLVRYTRYHGFALTPSGRRAALKVVRQHRLLELYLHEELGMPWDEVHDEADRLEHVLSAEVEARIAARLGEPTRDPHGDPIPPSGGEPVETQTARLIDLANGAKGTFVRVSDSDSGLLRELRRREIGLGLMLEVVETRAEATRIRVGGELETLDSRLASAMRVEVVA